MDDFKVSFLPGLFQKLEDMALISFIASVLPQDQTEQTTRLLRAFSKRGVSVKTVLDVFKELAQDEKNNND